MDKKKYTDALTNPVFEFIGWVAKDTGMRAFVIGGFVRDYFLGIIGEDGRVKGCRLL